LVNSLASLADEVRGKLRKSRVIRKQDLTPGCINANRNLRVIPEGKGTCRSEAS